METIIKRLSNLLSVKSLVTLVLTGVSLLWLAPIRSARTS